MLWRTSGKLRRGPTGKAAAAPQVSGRVSDRLLPASDRILSSGSTCTSAHPSSSNPKIWLFAMSLQQQQQQPSERKGPVRLQLLQQSGSCDRRRELAGSNGCYRCRAQYMQAAQLNGVKCEAAHRGRDVWAGCKGGRKQRCARADRAACGLHVPRKTGPSKERTHNAVISGKAPGSSHCAGTLPVNSLELRLRRDKSCRLCVAAHSGGSVPLSWLLLRSMSVSCRETQQAQHDLMVKRL